MLSASNKKRCLSDHNVSSNATEIPIGTEFAAFLEPINPDAAILIDSHLSNFSYIPKCYIAVGHMLSKFKSSSKTHKQLLDEFLHNFPCFTFYSKYSKQFNRVIVQVNEFRVQYPKSADLLIRTFNTNEFAKGCYDHRHTNLKFTKDDNCTICRPTHNIYEHELDNFLHGYYTRQVQTGLTPKQIYNQIDILNCRVANIFNKRSAIKGPDISPNSATSELDNLKKLNFDLQTKYDNILKEINENISHYAKNLDAQSALLYYGSGLSHNKIATLNANLFSYKLETPELDEVIKKLNCDISTVKPEVHDQIFDKYVSSVSELGKEPSFLKLGRKFNISGKAGGTHPSRISRITQAICYSKLRVFKSLNTDFYNRKLKPILLISLNKEHRKNFNLCFDRNILKLPEKKIADNVIAKMAEQGEILLGQPQPPSFIKTLEHFSGREIFVPAYSRKVDMKQIRNHYINKHSNFLRAQPHSFYENLDEQHCKEKLKEYHVYFEETVEISSKITNLKDFQKLLEDVETTRHFLVWWDHAPLLNYTYVLFNVQFIYNPAVYYSDILTERQLQKKLKLL